MKMSVFLGYATELSDKIGRQMNVRIPTGLLLSPPKLILSHTNNKRRMNSALHFLNFDIVFPLSNSADSIGYRNKNIDVMIVTISHAVSMT